MSNEVMLAFKSNEVITLLESLTIYRDLILPQKSRYIVDEQLKSIAEQLQIQGIRTYSSNDNDSLKIGTKVNINDIDGKKQGIIIGSSDTENFVKIIINNLDIIEVPITLITKEQ